MLVGQSCQEKYWEEKKWPKRMTLNVEDKVVIKEQLVARVKNANAASKFKKKKMKSGIFDGPQIRNILRDITFGDSRNSNEKLHGFLLSILSNIFWVTRQQAMTKNSLKTCWNYSTTLSKMSFFVQLTGPVSKMPLMNKANVLIKYQSHSKAISR